jgi:hypothetical protein
VFVANLSGRVYPKEKIETRAGNRPIFRIKPPKKAASEDGRKGPKQTGRLMCFCVRYKVGMKRITVLLACLIALSALPALADTGGIAGMVVDLDTGLPMANAAVAIYHLPLTATSPQIQSALTNRKGFFTNMGLDPGRYLVTAEISGRTSSCIIDDVYANETVRMKIEVGADGQRCIGPHVQSAVLDPSQTADLYRIH